MGKSKKNNNSNKKNNSNELNNLKRKLSQMEKSLNSNSRGIGGAPVAVSRDLEQKTRFSTGKNGQSLVMRTCFALSQLARIANSDNGSFGGFVSTAPATRTAIQLSPTLPLSRDGASSSILFPYLSPILELIASAFVKFKVKKCIFHYEPQSAATDGQRMVFAYASDPIHPLIWKPNLASNELLALADSIAFMPWKEWSMDVSHRLDGTEFFCYVPEDGASTNDRFFNWGTIGCITSEGAAASRTISGVLYVELDIEFLEFDPIVQNLLVLNNPKDKKEKELPSIKEVDRLASTYSEEDLESYFKERSERIERERLDNLFKPKDISNLKTC